jgi:hypothetical protein
VTKQHPVACGGVGSATDHVKAEWYVNKSLVIPKCLEELKGKNELSVRLL